MTHCPLVARSTVQFIQKHEAGEVRLQVPAFRIPAAAWIRNTTAIFLHFDQVSYEIEKFLAAIELIHQIIWHG